MTKKLFKCSIVLIVMLLLSLLFVFSSSATTGLSQNSVVINKTINATVDLPVGTVDVTWQCVPSGIVEFNGQTINNSVCGVEIVGKKYGTATINAVLEDSLGNTLTITVGSVHVVINDGIYRLRNNYTDQNYSDGTYYLRSQSISTLNEVTSVLQLSQNNFGDVTNQIYNCWRITHVGNGEHVFRSVANENKVLNYSNNSLSISTIESTVPDSAKWYIRDNTIIPKTAPSKCIAITSPTPTTAMYSPNVYYNYFGLCVNTIGNMSFEKWSFSKNTGMSCIKIRDNTNWRLYDSASATINLYSGSINIEDIGYTLLAYANGSPGDVMWLSENTSVASVNSSGLITLHDVGDVIITAGIMYYDSSGNEVFEYCTFYLSIIADYGITNNEKYYLMNAASGMYLSLISSNETNSTPLCTLPKAPSNEYKWTIQRYSNGKYQFVNNVGSATKVLTVSEDGAYIYTDSNSQNQIFEVFRYEGNTPNQGLYYIKYGSYYITESFNNTICLSTIFSVNALWSFMSVEKGDANMYGFLYEYTETDEDGNVVNKTYDSTAQKSNFEQKFSSWGYNANGYVNQSASYAYNKLVNSDVFVFRGHAGAGVICFYNETCNNLPTGAIVAQTNTPFYCSDRKVVASIQQNGLSQMRCVLLLGCNSGNTKTVGNVSSNTVDAFYNRGAHFVLGTTVTMKTSANNLFLDLFIYYTSAGYSIEDALEAIDNDECDFAVSLEGKDGSKYDAVLSEFPSYYLGDIKQRLN